MQIKPILDKKIEDFLSTNKLFHLEKKYSTPFHIIFPSIFIKNLNKLENFFISKRINSYKIFFSYKAITSKLFPKFINPQKTSVEVSSEEELKNLLNLQYDKKNLLSNGPKSHSYLEILIKKNINIVVNTIDELKILSQKKVKNNLIIRVGNLNLNKFSFLGKTKFGINENDIANALKIIKNNNLNFLGFSFHLDTTSDDLKKIYLKKLIEFTLIAKKDFNIDSKIIDIGGGIRINYIDKKNWDKIINFIYEKIFKKEESFFWNNYNFGIVEKNNRLFGEGNFYPFYSQPSEFEQIDYILNTEFQNEKIINIINDLGLQLWIEPGRLLLNQVSGTFFKIQEVSNNQIIFIDGRNTDIGFNLDILYDPLLIKKSNNCKKIKNSYFIFGNTCLEDDVFYKRKIFFEKKPENGDLLYFHNTAAYKIGIYSNYFINYKAIPKIFLDENYKELEVEY